MKDPCLLLVCVVFLVVAFISKQNRSSYRILLRRRNEKSKSYRFAATATLLFPSRN